MTTPAAPHAAPPLWTAAEILAATGGRGQEGWTASGVSIDSRTIAPGELFVAIQGDRHDGHAFAADALARGAAAAIVARSVENVPAAANLVWVEETLEALRRIGAAARARTAARLIAVTGSVGKTGTKEALRHVLAAQGPTHASAGSLNNHWGLPLSLARLPRETRFAVLEMGMNHAGEITPLSLLARPHVALITTVEAVHLEFFASVEAIADAKSEIFAGMDHGGIAVLNRDNAHYERCAAAARAKGIHRILGFGADRRAEFRLLDADFGAAGSLVRADAMGRVLTFRIGVPGRHIVQNMLGVLAAVEAAGGDVEAASRALATLTPPAGRGARSAIALPGGGTASLIDESYNASPAAMRAAIAVLAAMPPGPGGRRILALGDMRELGEAGPMLHAGLAPAIEEAGIDLVFTCGPLMQNLHEALLPAQRGAHALDSEDLAPMLAAALRPGDVVTVKGSLGSRMAIVVKALAAAGAAAAPPR
ncbi:MAG: UDP-N-acetylmuramoylalanyl-D-glutamyl-2,6-diaminopimelate--D-alanyl-D-alanine ligase [Alphaproteobacteria bacterium]|nr:UDP-N-acetylmuramoylalanyl-D-glutamyl-2,6-diaminopimelate--D-alanyl-D-alanine ligase [Alphaproteobacteria bacterium]